MSQASMSEQMLQLADHPVPENASVETVLEIAVHLNGCFGLALILCMASCPTQASGQTESMREVHISIRSTIVPGLYLRPYDHELTGAGRDARISCETPKAT